MRTACADCTYFNIHQMSALVGGPKGLQRWPLDATSRVGIGTQVPCAGGCELRSKDHGTPPNSQTDACESITFRGDNNAFWVIFDDKGFLMIFEFNKDL